MRRKAAKNLSLAISLLLVASLLSAVAPYRPDPVHCLQDKARTVQLDSALMACAIDTAILNQRADSNAPEELFNSALILKKTSADLTRVSACFLIAVSDRLVQRTEQAPRPIRAPPCVNA